MRRVISALDLTDKGANWRENFWAKVDSGPVTACWLWLAYRKANGYGQVKVANRRFITASRAAYALTYGPIPQGQVVCHTCDNPPCCNPAHLFLGTASDNALDSVAKGRANRAWGEAHPFARLTESQVLEIRAAPRRRGLNRALSREFGVSPDHISRIRARRKWRNLEGVTS